MDELKKQILDAAKTLASTPESDAYGTPEVIRYKVHALIEACENLVRDNAEIIKWVKVVDRMPEDFCDVLAYGKMYELDSEPTAWPGYFDSLCWRCANADKAFSVTHWAEMPKGSVQ